MGRNTGSEIECNSSVTTVRAPCVRKLMSADNKMHQNNTHNTVTTMSWATQTTQPTGVGIGTPASMRITATLAMVSSTIDRIVALSILPMGGSTRRSGRISGLVSDTMATAGGLR